MRTEYGVMVDGQVIFGAPRQSTVERLAGFFGGQPVRWTYGTWQRLDY